MFAKFYRKIEQGHALIRKHVALRSRVHVSTGRHCLVYYTVSSTRAALMDSRSRTIEIDRSVGQRGLICRDNIRADIR